MAPSEGKARLPLLGATHTSAIAMAAPFTRHRDRALVTVVGGPDDGATMSVGVEPATIGSAPDCDLSLTDATVSRYHAEARWTGAALALRDLDSKNGSFVGDSRFDSLSAPLGATFRVGGTRLKIEPDHEVLSPAASDGHAFGSLIGSAPLMRQLFALIDQVAATDVAVLIEGETGVGKELVADEIHRRSRRRDGPFTVFDCGAVPSELIESTLFGHRRGAFTGATADRHGVFDAGDGGTVFLDEIGELRLDLQPTLLRALDRGQIRPVGATDYATVDVRVIAASHRQFGDMIEGGTFREDLYYRLAVVRLRVPPLRERREDVPLLVRHFLRRLGRSDLDVTAESLAAVADYSWPGNVRELRNTVERAVALAAGGDIDLAPTTPRKSAAPSDPSAFARMDVLPSFRDAKAAAIEAFEQDYFRELLERTGGIKPAARAAGMDRKHLRMLLRRYGLSPVEPPDDPHQ